MTPNEKPSRQDRSCLCTNTALKKKKKEVLWINIGIVRKSSKMVDFVVNVMDVT